MMRVFLNHLMGGESGASMIEYSLLVALIGLALVTAVTSLGSAIGASLDTSPTRVSSSVATS